MSINVPSDPVALALPVAEAKFTDPSFIGSPEDMKDLARLDRMAGLAGLVCGWVLDARRGFITPAEFGSDEEISVFDLNGLYFEGTFGCYSRLSVGQDVGEGAIRALCLTFAKGILIKPNFVELEEGDLLHVPVLAVDDIKRSESLPTV